MAEKKSATGSEEVWQLKEIQKLIDLLIQRDVAEFELEKDGVRIRVRRAESRTAGPASPPTIISPAVLPLTIPTVPAAPHAVAAAPAAEAPAPAARFEPAAPPVEAPPSESTDSLYIIKSPLVGTFYASPSPNAEAFVKPGDAVRVGQILCIIEAMKLMNEIESETSGEIIRIYVENGQPVEYGQSLFAIKPSLKR
ncbi:MAG TPA: acetyl-CoA carboxylase biotin carboxyl carrier protein [Terriglobia bacterium]|nr:acetyl-CoA carboxylase biotin carboxyl carrier protein [Terriglobia bacterium]